MASPTQFSNLAVETLGFALAQQIAEDSGDSNIQYVGYANPGTATSVEEWAIKRIDSTTGVVIEWANGNNYFINEWDERENLSYS